MAKKSKGIAGKIIRVLTTYLTLLFLTLRACDVIDWPWYWVLSPLLLTLCILLLSCVLLGTIAIAENES